MEGASGGHSFTASRVAELLEQSTADHKGFETNSYWKKIAFKWVSKLGMIAGKLLRFIPLGIFLYIAERSSFSRDWFSAQMHSILGQCDKSRGHIYIFLVT